MYVWKIVFEPFATIMPPYRCMIYIYMYVYRNELDASSGRENAWTRGEVPEAERFREAALHGK